MHSLSFLLFRFFFFISNHLPQKVVYKILDAFAVIAYRLDGKHRDIALANLDLAFGERLSSQEKRKIAKESFRNLFYNLYEFLILDRLDFDVNDPKVCVAGEHYLKEEINQQKPIIFVSAHMGAWECGLKFLSQNYLPVTLLARKLNNPYVDREYKRLRKRGSSDVCYKHEGLRCIFKRLQQKQSVLITIDQALSQDEGVVVDFFGKKVVQPDIPLRLAAKTGATILPFFVHRQKNKICFVFEQPLEIEREMDKQKIDRYSQDLSDLLQKHIETAPKDWFWLHRRWKSFYSKIYR